MDSAGGHRVLDLPARASVRFDFVWFSSPFDDVIFGFAFFYLRFSRVSFLFYFLAVLSVTIAMKKYTQRQ